MDEIMRNEQAVTVTLKRIDLCNLILACNSISYLRKQTGESAVKWDRLHENLKVQLQALDKEPCSPVPHCIAFEVQNGGTLMFQQVAGVDHDVTLYTHYPDGSDENKITITPGDMVMMANLYRYIIENDIQDDFVNYGGKNKMRHVTMADEQPHPIKHGNYLIVWIDKFDCWCIYDERGDKVREPYWATVYEAEQAIESGEAL